MPWKTRPETCHAPVKGEFQYDRNTQRVKAQKKAPNIHTFNLNHVNCQQSVKNIAMFKKEGINFKVTIVFGKKCG